MSPWPPPMRAVADTSVPVICAITRSTGPPGANWMMAKLISMIPNMVGMMSRMRFRRYCPIRSIVPFEFRPCSAAALLV